MKAEVRPSVSKSASSGRFLSLRIQTKRKSVDDERANCKRRRREATRGLCSVAEVVSFRRSVSSLATNVDLDKALRMVFLAASRSLTGSDSDTSFIDFVLDS